MYKKSSKALKLKTIKTLNQYTKRKVRTYQSEHTLFYRRSEIRLSKYYKS